MTLMSHLWEAKHSYYFSQGDLRGMDETVFESWGEFLAEFGDADNDYNLVVRWDWREGEDNDLTAYNGDDYYRHARLRVCFVAQRKGFCWYREAKVCRADEPAIRAYLEPRLAHLRALWEPMA
jgi:hypothetical protein